MRELAPIYCTGKVQVTSNKLLLYTTAQGYHGESGEAAAAFGNGLAEDFSHEIVLLSDSLLNCRGVISHAKSSAILLSLVVQLHVAVPEIELADDSLLDTAAPGYHGVRCGGKLVGQAAVASTLMRRTLVRN